MYQISASERKELMKQADKARMLYRWLCALPYAAAVVAVISLGMWLLK